MQTSQPVTNEVVRRLHRAQGQLNGIVTMLEAGRDCTDIVTQIAAVTKALNRAGFRLVADGLKQRSLIEATADEETLAGLDRDRLERLFLSLA